MKREEGEEGGGRRGREEVRGGRRVKREEGEEGRGRRVKREEGEEGGE